MSNPETRPKKKATGTRQALVQDKNFTVRLKAAIDKRMDLSGIGTMPHSIDKYSSDERKAMYAFQKSLESITLGYLQGLEKDEFNEARPERLGH